MRLPGKRAAAEALFGLPGLARAPAWRGALVLAYHRIRAEADGNTAFDPGLFSATATSSDAQMRFLATHFEVVSPEAIERAPDRTGRRVVVTFDDGYRDNYELALPVLRRHGIPAAFFLATGFLDEPHVAWWDELAWMVTHSPRPVLDLEPWLDQPLHLAGDRRHAIDKLTRLYKTLPTERTGDFLAACGDAAGTGRCDASHASGLWMSWEMAARLRDAGMWIGGHTKTHPVLGRTRADAQRLEVEACARRIEEELGVKMDYFAYPVGLPGTFDTDTRRILREAGVKLAFSLYGGYLRPGRLDRYDVPRASVSEARPPRAFRAMLTQPGLFARW